MKSIPFNTGCFFRFYQTLIFRVKSFPSKKQNGHNLIEKNINRLKNAPD